MNSKRILVTGASRGIGFELVKLLSEKGHKVLAVSRNTKNLIEINDSYLSLIPFQAEITSKEDLTRIQGLVKDEWGSLDVLIHNAGTLLFKPFAETSEADFIEVYKVNVFAVSELTRVLDPYLISGAHVVAISSMGGVQGSMKFPGLAAYSSSKGAVITLMELLAEEYKERKVSFNTLALGAVQTEMLEEAFPDYKAPVTAVEMADYIAEFALKGHNVFNGKVLPVSNSTP
ncbi:SDR family NAD(P)-dependent oxidoreductase [Lutimonas zeaxanthinifaciens]|uniref:SDR family NAD(P)-dependent oxidoreductase n=1 Tax=Lutimonas zeaxanthinifaciens TaxID=3060215 RepID=UPI00265D1634|nr:SDR family oxidoreductase [Lutimonas sp. YSD2104]WKK65141.1 SDR family oxidoreductase [Lutimonas sp. YSD2104]